MNIEDIGLLIFCGVVIVAVVFGVLFSRWESKKATSYYEKKKTNGKDSTATE